MNQPPKEYECVECGDVIFCFEDDCEQCRQNMHDCCEYCLDEIAEEYDECE